MTDARPGLYNCAMRKTVFKSAVLLFAAAAALLLCGCVKKTASAAAPPLLSGIELAGDPARYYAPGEPLDFSGADLRLLFSDGSSRTIPLTDENVRITAPGTDIAGRTDRVTLWYGGLKTSFPYHVSPADRVVKSVSFKEGDKPPAMRFAKTDLRKNAPREELNHLRIEVEYRPGKNGETPPRTVYDLSEVSYQSRGIATEGWDATIPGTRNLTFSFLAETYDVPYEIVDGDWMDHAELIRSPEGNYPVRNYLAGSPFDAAGSLLKIVYDSKRTKQVPITPDMVLGFDTSLPCLNREFRIRYKEDGDEVTYANKSLLNYSVFARNDTSGVRKVELLRAPAPAVLDVRDPMTFDMYRKNTQICVRMDGGTGGDRDLALLGSDESVILRYSVDDGATWGVLDEELFEELKTKGRVVRIRAAYVSPEDALSTEEYELTIKRKWIRTEIEEWQETFYVQRDGIFDFGDAKIRRVYDDGSADKDELCDEEGFYLLQDVYLLPVETEDPETKSRTWYGFDINTSSDALDVSSFDTSAAGTFEDVYYVWVACEGGTVRVNGEDVECTDSRLYVRYVVREPDPPAEPAPGGDAPAQ